MNSLTNQKPNPFQPAPKPKHQSPPSFVEALKSIGGQTARTVSHDLIGNTAKDFLSSVTGNIPQRNEFGQPTEQPYSQEAVQEEILRQQRHKEVVETRLFDRKEEETKKQIQALQDQLKMLAKELAGMDKQLQKAIEEEIVAPGTYHLNFFEKLRRIIIDLRKRVVDSISWMETSSQRKAAQQGYWGKVKTSGTKFMLSQERYMSTQAG